VVVLVPATLFALLYSNLGQYQANICLSASKYHLLLKPLTIRSKHFRIHEATTKNNFVAHSKQN